MKQFSLNKHVLEILPISTRKGIEELDSRFLKMKHGLLSNDQFVLQIQKSIETFFHSLEDAYCEGGENSQLLDQLAYIEDGIQFIKGAMTNRLQASRYLYEPNLFNPHNMGPFSSLYLFYEEFTDLFERLVLSYNNTRNEPWAFTDVNFLMDISAYSSVRAQVFVPHSCAKSPANILVGITINEHSFFQVKATMVLLLHEIGHYVRPFKRRKRNQVLVDVVVNWLQNMVYGQLNDYVYAELLHFNPQSITDEEKKKIGLVREHFEQVVFPIINPVISLTLNECFEKFIKSEKITSLFGDQDQFANFLEPFHEILVFFLAELSNELSEILLLPIRRARTSEETPSVEEDVSHLGVKTKILNYLKSEVEIEDGPSVEHEVDKIVYFRHLCNVATDLFEPGNIFEYRQGRGNSGPDLAISSYLNSLALMGLTEINSDNLEHFTNVIIRCLKRALETMQEEAVLGMLIRSLEEVLANMFWIRTLDISDFETYWEIFEPLLQQAAFSEQEQTRFFGIPNAIITEYFDLRDTGEFQENRKYNLSPINTVTPLPRVNNLEHAPGFREKWIEEFRYIFFVPIAQYLLEEENIFPEKLLFQIEGDKSLSKDGHLIQELRKKFKKFSSNTLLSDRFANELEMIEFFKHTS